MSIIVAGAEVIIVGQDPKIKKSTLANGGALTSICWGWDWSLLPSD